MWFFFIAIPILFSVGLNNCAQVNAPTASTDSPVLFQSIYGATYNLPRKRVSSPLVARLLQKNGGRYYPVPNMSVTFTVSGPGTTTDTTLITNASGTVQTYFSTASTLGLSTVTATTASGLTTTFAMNVLDYSPTSAVISSPNTLEYVIQTNNLLAPTRTDQIVAPGVSTIATLDLSQVSTNAVNSLGVASDQAPAPTSHAPVLEKIARATDNITINVAATFKDPTETGTCSPTYFSIPSLLYVSCNATSGITFTRDKLAYTGVFQVTETASNESSLDVLTSNSVLTKANTLKQISNINASSNDSPQGFTEFNQSVYFTALNPSGFRKLYKYSGNTIFQVTNLNPLGDDQISNMVPVGSFIYFGGMTASGQKLYRYNGTLLNQISNLNNGTSDQINNLLANNGNLLFTANAGSGQKLFNYNPSLSKIFQLTNINPGANDNVSNMAVASSGIFFQAGVSGQSKLFKLSSGITSQISNLVNGGDDLPSQLVSLNNVLYFVANKSSGVAKVFSYNGTQIIEAIDLNGDSVSDVPRSLLVSGSKLYLSLANSQGSAKLYSYDGTNLSQVSNLNPNGTDNPQYLTAYGSGVYFDATTDGSNYNMFRFDGSSHLAQMSDIMGDGGHDNPTNIAEATNAVFLSAYTVGGQLRMYRFCDASLGCFP